LPSIQTYSALSALAMASVSSLRFRSGLTENPTPCPCVNRVAPLPGSGEPRAHFLHAAKRFRPDFHIAKPGTISASNSILLGDAFYCRRFLGRSVIGPPRSRRFDGL